ncbi:MAG: putative secreted protein [Parachlamydiales bacterium]|nr:putative secreted protein [Parachlamydiales bacterium]
MNIILLSLASFEKGLSNYTNLARRAWQQLTRPSSSIAPAALPFFGSTPLDQPPLLKFSYRPPRYFARGTLEKDRKRQAAPDFFLLTETNETPRPRPLPNQRKLLRSLCRGKGILRQNEQGYTYLDVDNQFILRLLPYLTTQGLSRPPYLMNSFLKEGDSSTANGGRLKASDQINSSAYPHLKGRDCASSKLFSSPVGAHIPVIPAREARFRDIGPLNEINREYSFEIEGFYSVQPSTWPEVEQVWYLKAICPELEQLRRKYFLPALPGGHSFVIATAIQLARAKPSAAPMMRISPSAYAA